VYYWFVIGMSRNTCTISITSAGIIFLIFALMIPGAMASSTDQPGYIVVGLSPVAQFDAHYAYSTVPTKVMFIDNSLGSTPLTYKWDFGDGATSTEQNPIHMYIQRGTYTVKLTVTNLYGSSTEIKNNFISIGMGPKADFTANPTTGSAPLAVKFTDLTQGTPTQWLWDFGDGQGSTEQNPVHTYWTGGVYNVILTTSNEYGSSDATKTKYINTVGDLTAKFDATPGTGKAPLDVQFTDRSVGRPTTWKWDFGDGQTSTLQNPKHTFTSPASFDVRLTVTRGDISDSTTNIVNIGGVPNADFVGAPTSLNTNDAVKFTDKSANLPTAWSWDFGDTATSTLQNPSHSYQLKGIYTVSLMARNDNGKDTEVKKAYINVGIGPKAEFIPIITPYQMNQLPMLVNFVDQSTGLPSSWQWDFGDGQTSTLQNPNHVYAKEGTYTVSLTAKNIFGTDTKVREDLITVGRGAAVDFRADKTTVGIGRIVTFTDLSANNPTDWVWEFGDGSLGTGSKPDHVYQKTGVYDVTLTASNPSVTNSRTKNQYITVLNLPRSDFVADKTRGGAPMTVKFTDLSKGAPISWNWNFGDGSTSSDSNPVHQYTTLGTFTVTLTTSNVNGQDTTSKTGYIVTTLAPVANFKVDQRIGKAPFIVQFKDLSTNNPVTWNWEFGDGTTSSEQNPRHIYPQEGAYDVRLTVSNQYGSDTAYRTGSSAETAASTIQQTAVITQAPTLVKTVATTAAPATTMAPLSPMVTIIGSIMGLLVIAIVYRK
jgi:PKD repeat protein